MLRSGYAAVGLAVLAIGAAGCGSDDNNDNGSASTPASTPAAPTTTTTAKTTPAAAGGGTVTLGESEFKITPKDATAKAGKVTIDMKNASPVPHDISIEGGGVDQHGKQVKGGGTSTVSVDLKPGSYTFYCSVDAHRQGGMKGTLKVAG